MMASDANADLSSQQVSEQLLNAIHWDAKGLTPAIAQQHDSGKILMVAWMNRTALQATMTHGRAVYYSRSRGELWHKGEQSGHVQVVKAIRIDCDADVILLQVEQIGGIACHTGRHSCFYRQLANGAWQAVEPVLKPPSEIYGA